MTKNAKHVLRAVETSIIVNYPSPKYLKLTQIKYL